MPTFEDDELSQNKPELQTISRQKAAKDADEVVSASHCLSLEFESPDVTCVLHTQGGVFYASIFDAGPRMWSRVASCAGRLSDHAALLAAFHSVFTHFTPGFIALRIAQRHNLPSRKDAKASGHKFKVVVSVTDQKLVELGDVMSSAPDSRRLLTAMTQSDADAYRFMAKCCEQIDIEWQFISPSEPKVKSLASWADSLELSTSKVPPSSAVRALHTMHKVA